jgi:hypothetical protein
LETGKTIELLMKQTLLIFARPLAVLLFAVMALGLTGCKKSENKSGSDVPQQKPRIALVMKSLANEFFSTMAEAQRSIRPRTATTTI